VQDREGDGDGLGRVARRPVAVVVPGHGAVTAAGRRAGPVVMDLEANPAVLTSTVRPVQVKRLDVRHLGEAVLPPDPLEHFQDRIVHG
jgi:hypothetical protein